MLTYRSLEPLADKWPGEFLRKEIIEEISLRYQLELTIYGKNRKKKNKKRVYKTNPTSLAKNESIAKAKQQLEKVVCEHVTVSFHSTEGTIVVDKRAHDFDLKFKEIFGT